MPRSPTSTLFPYTTLFRSLHRGFADRRDRRADRWTGARGRLPRLGRRLLPLVRDDPHAASPAPRVARSALVGPDRKSTRLNSSHSQNLVCRLLLEKKKKNF